MADLTPDDLDRLEALAAAATPGPWATGLHPMTPRLHRVVSGLDRLGDIVAAELWSADDAALIAAAREAVPALVAEVRRLRALVG